MPTEAIVGRVKLGAGAPAAQTPAALEADTSPMLAGDALATDVAVEDHGESVCTHSPTHVHTRTHTHMYNRTHTHNTHTGPPPAGPPADIYTTIQGRITAALENLLLTGYAPILNSHSSVYVFLMCS